MANNSYSEKFNMAKEKQLKEALVSGGFIFDNVDHALWRAKGANVNVVLYKSGKLLVQGKGTDDFASKYLGVSNQLSLDVKVKSKNKIEHDFSCWIGTDESGKGDYFGPLIIAGVLVDEQNKEKLLSLGIKDSKKMKDSDIEKAAIKIKANSVFSIITINPQKYNDLYSKFNNLNKLLAWGHARSIENILEKTQCNNAISDKFGDESLIKNALMKKGRNINLVQRTKAESDLAVAAASVLARNEFVQRMKKMSLDYSMEFPKGASQKVTDQANNFIGKYGIKLLGNVAKLHFKTTNTLNKSFVAK